MPFLPADIVPPIQKQQEWCHVLSSTSAVQTGVTSVAINFHISTLGCELQQLRVNKHVPGPPVSALAAAEGYGGHLGEETPGIVWDESPECL